MVENSDMQTKFEVHCLSAKMRSEGGLPKKNGTLAFISRTTRAAFLTLHRRIILAKYNRHHFLHQMNHHHNLRLWTRQSLKIKDLCSRNRVFGMGVIICSNQFSQAGIVSVRELTTFNEDEHISLFLINMF